MARVKNLSSKRMTIDKDRARIVIIMALSAAVVVFSLFAARVLVSKMFHQNKVVTEKEKAHEQLKVNLDELSKLQTSYRTFENAPESVLGNPGESNSKIVLDALPSKYDYAALLTSVEQILSSGGYNILEVSGSDQELEVEQVSADPVPVEIPLRVGVETSYQGANDFLANFDRSIRPFNVRKLQITGEDAALNVFIDFVTYYQPEKKLDIGTKEVE